MADSADTAAAKRSRYLLGEVIELADDVPGLTDAELRDRLARAAGRRRQQSGAVRRLTRGATMGTVVCHVVTTQGRGLIEMAKHGDKSTDSGQGNYDLTKSKDVKDAGGGRHSSEDKGDRDDQGDEKGKK